MMKRVITLITALCITQGVATAQSNRIICDETCKSEASGNISGAASSSEMNYAVVSPVGRGTVEMILQAPRLTTLAGKTIAVVGGSFMASVTHPEIKRLILEHYPSAKVLLLDEIGSAGVYPAPGVVRRSKEEFQARWERWDQQRHKRKCRQHNCDLLRQFLHHPRSFHNR